jgi:dihydropteroate synthase
VSSELTSRERVDGSRHLRRCDVTIFSILNITEDSFSDGGRYLDPTAALEQAAVLIDGGADVLDLGAASSHPDAKSVSASEEIDRLGPVVEALAGTASLSIDTWRPEVQRWALANGVSWLNDIRGFGVPDLYEELRRSRCGLVLMHSVTEGATAAREDFPAADVLRRVETFWTERLSALMAAGIDASRIVLDPGMGLFLGGEVEASLNVLRGIADLRKRFANQLMISVSRKSVIGALSGRPVAERGAAGLAVELYAIEKGARYIRTHDSTALGDALRTLEGLEA